MTGEELRSDSSLTWIASGLRRFHGSGLELPTSFHVLDIANRYAEISRGAWQGAAAGVLRGARKR